MQTFFQLLYLWYRLSCTYMCKKSQSLSLLSQSIGQIFVKHQKVQGVQKWSVSCLLLQSGLPTHVSTIALAITWNQTIMFHLEMARSGSRGAFVSLRSVQIKYAV